jgi:PAS domain S-box-containing protein
MDEKVGLINLHFQQPSNSQAPALNEHGADLLLAPIVTDNTGSQVITYNNHRRGNFTSKVITDVLKSKQEIETTRELLDETEELLQFGSWAWDIGAHTVTWTSGLYSLLGYTPLEVAGRIDFDFYLRHVVEEFAQPLRDMIERSVREKTDFSCEYLIKTGAGVARNVSTRGKLVKDEAGEVIKVLCINRDVTALRNFEKEQERYIRELNRSNRDLEEFAYIASHDLQEPLRKISMFTERLKAKFENSLDQEGELFLGRILASAGNMRTLIDNLLDFSRANRRSNTFDQVDIKWVFDAVISELELKIEETKTTIRRSGTFPSVEAVPSEMMQLFGNIMSNAIKFSKNSAAPEIQVHGARITSSERTALGLPDHGTFHKIEIQDNGIGFDPEYSEKIFQIFQRLNGKAEYPGSGIGLAICKKIVEKHNGLIFAKSVPDQGATFTVILPEKQY